MAVFYCCRVGIFGPKLLRIGFIKGLVSIRQAFIFKPILSSSGRCEGVQAESILNSQRRIFISEIDFKCFAN